MKKLNTQEYTHAPKVYTILVSRDLKDQQVPPLHHQNKEKISALRSET